MTSVTTTPYSISQTTDYFLAVDTSTAKTLTLPSTTVAGTGTKFIIKDVTGNAAANNITINKATATLDAIDGAASYTINTNRGKVTLVCSAVNVWSVI